MIREHMSPFAKKRMLEMFERYSAKPENAVKVASSAVEHIKECLALKRSYEPHDWVTDEVTRRTVEKLSEKDFPELHALFRQWVPSN